MECPGGEVVQAVLIAANTLQVIALAYIAARFRPGSDVRSNRPE